MWIYLNILKMENNIKAMTELTTGCKYVVSYTNLSVLVTLDYSTELHYVFTVEKIYSDKYGRVKLGHKVTVDSQDANVKVCLPYQFKNEVADRYASACKAIEDENCNAALNLNSVIHLWEAKDQGPLYKIYADIPDFVIESIKRLLQLNTDLRDILFTGDKADVKYSEYVERRAESAEKLKKALEALNQKP